MFKRQHLAAAAAVVVAGALLTGAAAEAGTKSVTVHDYMYMPANISVAVGGTVTWDFPDSVAHTTTSTQGFWNSGSRSRGRTYRHTFTSSGSYPYFCDFHSYMTAKVKVPVSTSGGPSRGYKLTWASAPGTGVTTYDVQLRRPGSSRWVALRTNTTVPSQVINPRKAGTYDVRARTDRSQNSSGWSPVRSFRIT